MKQTIQVMYSCDKCGIRRRSVQVPSREEGQDVVYWMEKVCGPALCNDHVNHSPFCHPDRLKDVMVPIEKGTPVGAPVKPTKPKEN